MVSLKISVGPNLEVGTKQPELIMAAEALISVLFLKSLVQLKLPVAENETVSLNVPV
jgi:hypothetical protein